MKPNIIVLILLTVFAIPIFTNGQSNQKATEINPVRIMPAKKVLQPMATAPVIIYKTKKDYSQYVPVIMNAEKTRIMSYPHPTDLFFRGKPAYPTPLDKGYFLDNRGIGIHVAFLNYTYEIYSQLKDAPSMEQLMKNLLDKSPLLELWNCGSRAGFKDEVKELNALIKKGLPGCHQLVRENKVYFAQ
ncbi:MAG: hypothetical protein PHS30_02330 [Bacteroidales bacterium]|nr:hypothetical protein [Bacteroidales bacterium]